MNPEPQSQLPTTQTRGADRLLVDVVREIPTEIELRRWRKQVFLIPVTLLLLIGVILLVAAVVIERTIANSPVDYADPVEHFKYGSIGSEAANGIPYWIWKVLPEMFPEKLPGKGYASLGFIVEPGKETPIGFSQRTVFINRVGLNCSVCHVGTYRKSADSAPTIVPAMPANRLDLQGYINFLNACAADERFNPTEMMKEIDRIGGKLGFIERWIYAKIAIPQTRNALVEQGKILSFMQRAPEWGRGRVNTFDAYKARNFRFPMDRLPTRELVAAVDLPAVWNQQGREGMQLHWDGNNTSVDERNKSAALGAGVTPTSIDLPRIKRVADWLWTLQHPAYPFTPPDEKGAAAGKAIYERLCASCHDFRGAAVGKVTPLDKINTDPARVVSYTYEFLCNQNTLYAGYPWRFQHFRKTDGYANQPLDGVWLRAPYLHNGSVPTLRDLLEPPDRRPKTFFRGYDVYDERKVGFVSDVAEENGVRFFKYDTGLPGNGNGGHLYGTDLSAEDKEALVQYLKTL